MCEIYLTEMAYYFIKQTQRWMQEYLITSIIHIFDRTYLKWGIGGEIQKTTLKVYIIHIKKH